MKPKIYKQNGIWRHTPTDWISLSACIANHLAFEWCAKENGKILFAKFPDVE